MRITCTLCQKVSCASISLAHVANCVMCLGDLCKACAKNCDTCYICEKILCCQICSTLHQECHNNAGDTSFGSVSDCYTSTEESDERFGSESDD